MWGNSGHLSELYRIAHETYAMATPDGTRLEILASETNSGESTYDGVDWGGERVAKEVSRRFRFIEKEVLEAHLVMPRFKIRLPSLSKMETQ